MLISGCTFARNTEKLGYPTVESIQSILPICDEFIVAVGAGDADDTTRARIAAIKDPKIRIIDTVWSDLDRLRGKIFSQQTNCAIDECRGIWCLYLQVDEVIHERYLPGIQAACRYFAADDRVDGFLFKYRHFWGDYDHYFINHRWYPREIRIIRNGRNIVSVGDAQSFRYADRSKVRVVELDAEVFHYGHVRDPRIVNIRRKAVRHIYKGERGAADIAENSMFDYGSLERLPVYKGTHPAVMQERRASCNWKHLLRYSGKTATVQPHDRFKYRLLTFIEQKILMGSGREFWGYKPYRILRPLSRQFKRQTAAGVGKMERETLPLASLVIAVYNNPDVLEKTLYSCKNQTCRNFEIVIADDGSGPEIKQLVDRCQGLFPYPIKHVWHEDSGFRKTVIVNKAVVAASAPYCIFIDGDCILHHRFVEVHLRHRRPGRVLAGRRIMLTKQCSDMVTPDIIASRRIEKRSFWHNNCLRNEHHGYLIPGAFLLRNIFKRKPNDILGSNFSLHREDFCSVNGYDERIVGRGLEDDNLSVRLTMAGKRIMTIAYEALQYHLYHSAEPIPHSAEVIRSFRDAPEAAWTAYGLVKGRKAAGKG